MLGREERDLVARERGLPGMATLLAPERLEERLLGGLPGLDLRAVEPFYVRYKPATSLLAAYHLDVGGQRVEMYAKAYRSSEQARLDKCDSKTVSVCLPSRSRGGSVGHDDSASSAPLQVGQLVLKDLRTRLSFFPNDRKLRSLRRLGSADQRQRILRKLLPPDSGLDGAAMRPLAYKPERRFVGRLDDAGGPRVVLKLYTRSGYRQRSAADGSLPTCTGLLLARPLGRSARHGLVALPWLPGRLLSAEIGQLSFAATSLEAVGAALGELHRLADPSLGTIDPTRQCASLLAAATAVGATLTDVAGRARHLAHKVAAEFRRPLCPGVVHADFYAKQVLLDGGRVAFIDLDGVALGEPVDDLANFVAHLERDAVSGRIASQFAADCRESFLAGYRTSGMRFDPRRLELLTAGALLRLTPQPFRGREKDWPERTRGLLERAEAIADQAVKTTVARFAVDGFAAGDTASPYSRAIGAFAAHASDEPGEGCVERIEMRRQQLLLSATSNGWPRWYRLAGDRLQSLDVRADTALPLAASLNGELDVLAYRPGRRLVVRRRQGTRWVVEKGFRRRRFASMRALYGLAARATRSGPLGVPRILEYRDETSSIVFEHLPGQCIPVHADAEEGFTVVGAGLASFQDFPVDEAVSRETRVFRAADELRVLDEWAERVRRLVGELPIGWRSVRCELDDACDELPVARMGLTHRDLHEGQLLMTDRGPVLLDFDLLCRGDRALDAGNLLSHLELRSLQGHRGADARAVDLCAEAFLHGLVGVATEEFSSRLRFYRATSLLRLALVYRLRPRWCSLGPQLVRRALSRRRGERVA